MAELFVLIDSGNMNGDHFQDVMLKLWKMILGETCFDPSAPAINCMDHSIPKAQSLAILSRMCDRAGPLGSAQVGMSYINIAPSTFEEMA